ncbi:MAG TPA: biotin transporter BioY [Firmicutes bacterium]|jgi:biotin transport system substrate-specific component|nr:biotin transporter BioY [Bacillota bacterium]
MTEGTVASRNMNLRMTVYTALFTALMIIGGYISVPLPAGPVPIVLADFFVMVTGFFLGFKWGLTSVLLYLSLGVLGLPVFAGGRAGLAVLFGPTGGFLFGYLLLVASVGLLSSKGKPSIARNLTALVTGNILLYGAGVPWLKAVMNLGWTSALAAGLIPFIPGIIIKIAVASGLVRAFLPRFKERLVSFQ